MEVDEKKGEMFEGTRNRGKLTKVAEKGRIEEDGGCRSQLWEDRR